MNGSKATKQALADRAVESLYHRIVSIFEQARANVVRSVNSNMVLAYWLTGQEIVLVVQHGEERAEYGKGVLANLSERLAARYGSGFSVANLKNFRQFYLVYSDRIKIRYPPGSESELGTKRDPLGSEFAGTAALLSLESKPFTEIPTGLATCGVARGFCAQLSWSHYRALMRVQDAVAREFYEREAAECSWSKAQLERQIQSCYYQRIIANCGEAGLVATNRERLPGEPTPAEAILKSPYVLEFLGLPDSPVLHESALEQAIIDNLQSFLLELGKGFSFVAGQQHIRFEDDDFYIDLVFYNYILKCFLLIDLKIGKLTYRDVGQIDGYVRLFEDRFKVSADNPTIGLILCSDKSEAVAKYSVLNEGRQIFASKYLQFLPSEEELMVEIERERKLIDATIADASAETPGRDSIE